MTLLDLAARAARGRNWALAVAHLDHRQRAESAEEADFVAGQARARGLEVFLERLPDDLLQQSPLSEDAMRQARHACWRRAARAFGAGAVALAHQADDRAETFLIRLLAGTGPTGLAAIRPVETVGGLTLVRPLLAARREAMREYLRARGLAWREDPTNDALDAQRGWVRNRLLPLLAERMGPGVAERIAGASELLEAEAAAAREATGFLLDSLRREPSAPALDRLDLTAPAWREASPSLRRQLLREWLWRLRGGGYPPGRAAAEEALTFAAQAAPGAELRTVGHIHIAHLGGGLLAFGKEIPADERRAAASELLTARAKRQKKESKTAP